MRLSLRDSLEARRLRALKAVLRMTAVLAAALSLRKWEETVFSMPHCARMAVGGGEAM